MRTIVIIGLGNIGSFVAGLVARLPGVTRVILVDPDEYSQANLTVQAIDCSAIGRMKVNVQAEAMRAVNPALVIEAIAERVENVPLGTFLNCILLSCVDSQIARQTINRIAWRCGCPWIDAAVGAQSAARISTYVPGESASCKECSWDETSYALLEQEVPCAGGAGAAPATDAVAELGGLAACLQVAELRTLLSDGNTGESLLDRQFMLDTSTCTSHLNRVHRNPQCRFDHSTWEIESAAISLATDTLESVFGLIDTESDAVLRVESQWFTTYVTCAKCGRSSSVALAIESRLSPEQRTCDCGGRMMGTGFYSFDRLRKSELSREQLQRPLAATGLQPLDVVSLEDAAGRVRHFRIEEESSDE